MCCNLLFLVSCWINSVERKKKVASVLCKNGQLATMSEEAFCSWFSNVDTAANGYKWICLDSSHVFLSSFFMLRCQRCILRLLDNFSLIILTFMKELLNHCTVWIFAPKCSLRKPIFCTTCTRVVHYVVSLTGKILC